MLCSTFAWGFLYKWNNRNIVVVPQNDWRIYMYLILDFLMRQTNDDYGLIGIYLLFRRIVFIRLEFLHFRTVSALLTRVWRRTKFYCVANKPAHLDVNFSCGVLFALLVYWCWFIWCTWTGFVGFLVRRNVVCVCVLVRTRVLLYMRLGFPERKKNKNCRSPRFSKWFIELYFKPLCILFIDKQLHNVSLYCWLRRIQ